MSDRSIRPAFSQEDSQFDAFIPVGTPSVEALKHKPYLGSASASRKRHGLDIAQVYGRFASATIEDEADMTTFDEREKAFESRFVHDQDLAFRAEARRARKVGLWAAGLLGKTAAEAETYAEDLLTLSVAEGGESALVAKLRHDLAAAGADISDHQIYRQMNYALSQAIEQIMAE